MKQQFDLSLWLQDKSRKVVTKDGRPVRIICTDRKANSGNIVGLVGEDESLIYVWNSNGIHIVSCIEENDLFFADEEQKLQSIEIPFGAKDSEFVKDEYLIPEGCEARIEGNKVIIEKIQKEEELTEFEKAVQSICKNLRDGIDDISDIYVLSNNLLDLARKELKQEFEKELDEAYKNRDEVVYLEGYEKGQEEAKKIPSNPDYETFKNELAAYVEDVKNDLDCEESLDYWTDRLYRIAEEITLKDLPKFKKATEDKDFDRHVLLLEDDRVVLTTGLYKGDYYIELSDLKTLPKEE